MSVSPGCYADETGRRFVDVQVPLPKFETEGTIPSLAKHDPLLAALMGKLTAKDQRCAPLAGKRMPNRFGHSPQEGEARAPDRYHKISHDGAVLDRLFLDVFREAHAAPPNRHLRSRFD